MMGSRRESGRLARTLPAAMAGAMAVAACTPATPKSSAALPAPPAAVTVAMGEYRFDFDPDIPAGRVNFSVHNAGSTAHELILARLPPDYPPSLDAQLHSPIRRRVEALRALPVMAPGQGTVFAADLATGRYAFLCFVAGSDGTSHALKGMNAEFRVAEPESGPR